MIEIIVLSKILNTLHRQFAYVSNIFAIKSAANSQLRFKNSTYFDVDYVRKSQIITRKNKILISISNWSRRILKKRSTKLITQILIFISDKEEFIKHLTNNKYDPIIRTAFYIDLDFNQRNFLLMNYVDKCIS